MDIKKEILDVLFQVETMLSLGKPNGEIIEYIEKKKKEIEEVSIDKTTEYIDDLVNNLK